MGEDLLTQEMDDIFQDDGDDDVDNGILDSKYDNIDDEDVHLQITANIKKKSNIGFMAPMQLSTELADFLGIQFAPRTEVTKLIWQYIKTNDLQDPRDKRDILCDDRLESLFKKKKINMFKMTKALCLLMKSVEDLQEGKKNPATPKSVAKSKKIKEEKLSKVTPKASKKRKADTKSSKEASTSEKKPKKIKKEISEGGADSTSGKSNLCTLSPSLAALVGRPEESRFQVTALIWKHIKANNLQKESDKRLIVCDELMKKVFGVNEVHMFTMNKLLGRHFLPK